MSNWLDYIGLPQYEEAFTREGIDGAKLHGLSTKKMVELGIISSLHITRWNIVKYFCIHILWYLLTLLFYLNSIERALQVMRENKWNADCLFRWPKNYKMDEETLSSDYMKKDVYLWSSDMIAQWLRMITLNEVIPDLRGLGIHGGLLVFEDTFNEHLFADLLGISSKQYSFREHLSEHFRNLFDFMVQRRKWQKSQEIMAGECFDIYYS